VQGKGKEADRLAPPYVGCDVIDRAGTPDEEHGVTDSAHHAQGKDERQRLRDQQTGH